jgi:uncharacterized protein YceH (UPF0502 family)
MSSEPQPAPPALAGPWPVLNVQERRVLGVLVEKAKTTPDAYPMSVNALVTGCNQKSNRDPLLNLSDLEVEDTLVRCQKQGLAIKITGGRVIRWRHALYEAWHVDKIDLAVLAELLLRGPQTEGELRTRASRMEPLDDLDALRGVLKPLVERNLAVYLTPEDRRGAVVTHGFHDPHELERLRTHHRSQPVAPSAPAPLPIDRAPAPTAPAPVRGPSPAEEKMPALEAGLAETRAEVAALKKQVADLQDQLTAVRDEVRALKQALGV